MNSDRSVSVSNSDVLSTCCGPHSLVSMFLPLTMTPGKHRWKGLLGPFCSSDIEQKYLKNPTGQLDSWHPYPGCPGKDLERELGFVVAAAAVLWQADTGRFETYFVAQTGLELTVILQPQPVLEL